MNKMAFGAIAGILLIGGVGIYVLSIVSDSDQTELGGDPGTIILRPAVQAIPNTFGVMTPEEKATADEAARIAAEAAAQATSTATTTDQELVEETEADSEGEEQPN
jgi:hypothetical protein